MIESSWPLGQDTIYENTGIWWFKPAITGFKIRWTLSILRRSFLAGTQFRDFCESCVIIQRVKRETRIALNLFLNGLGSSYFTEHNLAASTSTPTVLFTSKHQWKQHH